MLAAVLEQRKTIVVRQVPEPKPGPGEITIAVGAVGICGTDIHAWLGAMEYRIPYPRILGHEFGGEVLELGPGVTGFTIGERVAVDPVFACGRCRSCRGGHLNTCENMNVFGIDSDGAMAERTVVRADKAHRLPGCIPMRQSIMVELYSVAVHSMRRTRIEPGDTVVILGCGRVGLAVLDVARQCGAQRIIVTDIQDYRLEVARKIGADITINVARDDPVPMVKDFTGGFGADKVIECIGEWTPQPGQNPPGWQAAEMMRPSGQITMMGQGPHAEPMPWRDFVLKEGSIATSRLNVGDVPRAIELLAAGRLHPDLIITHELPLAEAPRGFELADGQPRVIKVVLVP